MNEVTEWFAMHWQLWLAIGVVVSALTTFIISLLQLLDADTSQGTSSRRFNLLLGVYALLAVPLWPLVVAVIVLIVLIALAYSEVEGP